MFLFHRPVKAITRIQPWDLNISGYTFPLRAVKKIIRSPNEIFQDLQKGWHGKPIVDRNVSVGTPNFLYIVIIITDAAIYLLVEWIFSCFVFKPVFYICAEIYFSNWLKIILQPYGVHPRYIPNTVKTGTNKNLWSRAVWYILCTTGWNDSYSIQKETHSSSSNKWNHCLNFLKVVSCGPW